MKPRLESLRRVDDGIVFEWVEGGHYELSFRRLRQECPCAHCVHEVTGQRILDRDSVSQDICLRDMQPVGSYAYRLLFDDGHDTGIYSLDYLSKVCQQIRKELLEERAQGNE